MALPPKNRPFHLIVRIWYPINCLYRYSPHARKDMLSQKSKPMELKPLITGGEAQHAIPDYVAPCTLR